MKIFAINLCLFLSSTTAFSQVTEYPFLSGSWSTNNTKKITVITATVLDTPKLFKITAHGFRGADGIEAEFQLIVDGIAINGYLSGGTTAFVEARSLAIKKIPNSNTTDWGTWEIVQEVPEMATVGFWGNVLGLGTRKILTAFKTPQEFVIDIPPFAPSKPEQQRCLQATMNFYIENVPVRDIDGTIVEFPLGSSIYGKAKDVSSIIKTAQCGGQPGVVGVRGLIKIRPRKVTT